MISLRDVNKYFESGIHAVRDVSLEVNDGETMVLIGSSGSGKTTVLKMINRLIEPTSGTISINGDNILDRDQIEVRRSIGYVFQGIGLFPHLNIYENASVVLKLKGLPENKIKDRVSEVLAMVGLEPGQFMSRYPDELSGGQQQRVGFARAIAADPPILLMDEPFGALDAVTRDLLQQELLKLKEKLDKTIIFVTHDILEAFTLADRIAVLHDGELQQTGTKDEIIRSPETGFVKDLLSSPRKYLDEFRGLAQS